MAVGRVQIQCFLVGLSHEDLGPHPHPEPSLHLVEVLGYQDLGLLHEFRVDDGKKHGVVPHGILHQNDDLDIPMCSVEFHVHPVLDELDDGNEQVRVPVPEEDLVYPRGILPFPRFVEVAGVSSKQNHRQSWSQFLDLAAEIEGVHADVLGHGDHQVVVLARDLLQGLAPRGYPEDMGGRAEVQVGILPDDELRDQSLLLDDERVVEAGDEQDPLDLELHELVEDVALGFVILLEGLGPFEILLRSAAEWHGGPLVR